MRRAQMAAACIALLSALAGAFSVALGAVSLRDALGSYLFTYLVLLGLALGSLSLLLIHVLTGGEWAAVLRPILLASTRTLPLLALLSLPLLLHAGVLYPWAARGATLIDPALAHRRWYLDPPFFAARTAVCFAIWLALAARLRAQLAHGRRPRGLAGAGLVLQALTLLIAATDWIASLTPAYRSSAFGLMLATDSITSATAFAILVASHRSAISNALRRDLANVLLTLVLASAYLAFMQYLTAWVADLPPETAWYLPRTATSWAWLAVALVVSGLALPFAILIARRAKRSIAGLRSASAFVLAAQVAHLYWLIAPSLRPSGFAPVWTDAFAILGFGGVGALAFVRALRCEEAA